MFLLFSYTVTGTNHTCVYINTPSFQLFVRYSSTAVAAVEPEQPGTPVLNEALLQALKPREVVDQLNK